jgi:hypothetical protein
LELMHYASCLTVGRSLARELLSELADMSSQSSCWIDLAAKGFGRRRRRCDSWHGASFRLLYALPSYARGISAALSEARPDISTCIGATSASNEVAVKKC